MHDGELQNHVRSPEERPSEVGIGRRNALRAAPAGEPRGRGLGLLIARTLAERHGWIVSVEPAAPRGTRATLRVAAWS